MYFIYKIGMCIPGLKLSLSSRNNVKIAYFWTIDNVASIITIFVERQYKEKPQIMNKALTNKF